MGRVLGRSEAAKRCRGRQSVGEISSSGSALDDDAGVVDADVELPKSSSLLLGCGVDLNFVGDAELHETKVGVVAGEPALCLAARSSRAPL